MEQSPRRVFQRMFGAEDKETVPPLPTASLMHSQMLFVRLKRRVGITDRSRLAEYLDDVRALEKRIQKVENQNATGQRALVDAPLSVPDSFDTHLDLMFDLQRLALQCDITRIVSFKMGMDRSQRVYPESGVATPFHTLSHHRESSEKIEEFARLNQYHVGKVPLSSTTYEIRKMEMAIF